MAEGQKRRLDALELYRLRKKVKKLEQVCSEYASRQAVATREVACQTTPETRDVRLETTQQRKILRVYRIPGKLVVRKEALEFSSPV